MVLSAPAHARKRVFLSEQAAFAKPEGIGRYFIIFRKVS